MKLQNSAQGEIASLIAKNIPNEILSFKFSEELQCRIHQLVRSKKDGLISALESEELDKCLLYDMLIGLAKSKALK